MDRIIVTRRVLTPKEKRNILICRFGSLHDFSEEIGTMTEVARRLNINYKTVANFLYRFRDRGIAAVESVRYRKPHGRIGNEDIE